MSGFLAKPQKFIVRPAPGWTDIAFKEVATILQSPLQSYKFAPDSTIQGRQVDISNCDYRQAIELVLRLTTVHDVEWVLHSGRVASRAKWQEFIKKSKLSEVWPAGQPHGLHVSVRVSHPVVGTAKDVRRKVEEALQEMNITVASSKIDSNYDGRIVIDSQKNKTQLLVSLGGRPLYKRGYKELLTGATAPIAEHHAAACIAAAIEEFDQDFKAKLRSGKIKLLVPFAGTGTFGFEIVSELLNIKPGALRTDYSFKKFLFNPTKTVSTLESRLLAEVIEADVVVDFGDIDHGACETLRTNIKGFENKIKHLRELMNGSESKMCRLTMNVLENDFLKNSDRMCDEAGDLFIMLNPPYGGRLAKKSGGEMIYSRLGTILKNMSKIRKIFGFILCGDEQSWRKFLAATGSFSHRTRHFNHGGMDVRFVVFSSK